jgi:hypothetical protein
MYPKLDSGASMSFRERAHGECDATLGEIADLHGEQNVDQQVTSATSDEESTEWRTDDSDKDENNV